MALDLRAHPGAGYRQRDRHCHLHVAALCGPELLDHGQDATGGPAGVSYAQPEPAGQSGPLPLDCGHLVGPELFHTVHRLCGLGYGGPAGAGDDPVYRGDGAQTRPTTGTAVQPPSRCGKGCRRRAVWPSG